MLEEKEIIERLAFYLNKKRIEHTLGVRDVAERLANQYGADVKKVRIASLLHDIARDLSLDEMVKLVNSENNNLNKAVLKNPLLLHAYAGVIIAKRDFGIDDIEILNAIRYHTTGKKNMDLIAKIVFIADYIEPDRSFRGVKKARKMAFRDIKETLLYIYKSLIKHLVSQKRYICIDTIEAYNCLVFTD